MANQEIVREVQRLRLKLETHGRINLEVLAALSRIFREYGIAVSDELLGSLTLTVPEELFAGTADLGGGPQRAADASGPPQGPWRSASGPPQSASGPPQSTGGPPQPGGPPQGPPQVGPPQSGGPPQGPPEVAGPPQRSGPPQTPPVDGPPQVPPAKRKGGKDQ